MQSDDRKRSMGRALAACGFATARAYAPGPIRVGALALVTDPLVTSGKSIVDTGRRFRDEAKHEAGGREVEYVAAETTCNPDQAPTQVRRLVHQKKVPLLSARRAGTGYSGAGEQGNRRSAR